jgi:hypothetical protein
MLTGMAEDELAASADTVDLAAPGLVDDAVPVRVEVLRVRHASWWPVGPTTRGRQGERGREDEQARSASTEALPSPE